MAKHIYFAESALDAMSFYQLNANKIKLEESVFCSVGAVSYTHLDVYKRQGFYTTTNFEQAKKWAILKRNREHGKKACPSFNRVVSKHSFLGDPSLFCLHNVWGKIGRAHV